MSGSWDVHGKYRITVTVLRGGGRDDRGNPLPTTEIPVDGCLWAPRGTSEPNDFSDIPASRSVLYRSIHDGFRFHSTDQVVIPEDERGAGRWSVAGQPSEWPSGVEVPLERA